MDLSTNDGSGDLASLGIDKSWFDYPKPVKLIQLFVACATQRDSLVMDFFAGSGTTGHAVALQNQADGGRRSCISVNLPEPLASDQPARSAGLLTVADITRHRLGKVAEVVDGAAPLGLRSFRLTASNFDSGSSGPDQATTLDLKETTLLSKSLLIDDIAAEVLVGEGVQLGARWQRCRAGEADVIVSDGVAVVTSLEITEVVVDEALSLKPRVLVFLEDGFAGRDAVKANAFTSAKHLGITMKTV
jgi:adenine-specific DNA-methyltransferase